MRFVLGVTLAILLASPVAAAGPVETRQASGFDFSVLRTYSFAWEIDPERYKNHPVADGAPVDPSVERAVDKVLQAKGYERVSDGRPDFLVNCTGFVEDRLSVEGEQHELADGVSWIGAGPGTRSQPSQVALHRIDIIDTRTDEVVWSGWDTQVARDELARRRKLEKWTRKIIRQFPPD